MPRHASGVWRRVSYKYFRNELVPPQALQVVGRVGVILGAKRYVCLKFDILASNGSVTFNIDHLQQNIAL